MSEAYDIYIKEHKRYVRKAFDYLFEYLFKDGSFECSGIYINPADADLLFNCIVNHDNSKRSVDEYHAYDHYFYGDQNSEPNIDEFNRAWLHHIHRNPHHWQHWVFIEDDGASSCKTINVLDQNSLNQEKESFVKHFSVNIQTLDMPDIYIIEMICDWWSFSLKSGNPYEIFDWYENHKQKMILSDSTRHKVESVLALLYATLKDANIVVENTLINTL